MVAVSERLGGGGGTGGVLDGKSKGMCLDGDRWLVGGEGVRRGR
jgi:hypothetical protein